MATDFEQQLQVHDADVTLPYRDWEDRSATAYKIFVDRFAGSFGTQAKPADVTHGKFAYFPVANVVGEAWGVALQRSGGRSGTWHPQPGSTVWLEDLRVDDDFHALWIFWQLLETG